MALDPAAAIRLTKLLGMVGSAHDAEALAAARKADALVRGLGLTWGEILDPDPAPALVQWREPPPGDWQDAVAICIYTRGAKLTAWDRKFLISISQRDDLTERQWAQLTRILDNCRLHACCS